MEGVAQPVERPRMRRRVVKACLACRSRKVKCDLSTPICSACKVKGITECVYDDSPFGTNIVHEELSKLRQENERLRRLLKAVKPTGPASPQSGTVARYRTVENDYEIDLSKMCFLLETKDHTVFYGLTSYLTVIERVRWSYIAFLRLTRKRLKQSAELEDPELANEYRTSATLPDSSDRMALFCEIQRHLPSWDTVSVILLEYANGLWHQMFPILDRAQLMQDFEALFKKEPDGRCRLMISGELIDYSRLALILVVVRMVLGFQHQSAKSIDATIYTDPDNLLLNYARILLDCANYRKRASFPALQATVLLSWVRKLEFAVMENSSALEGSTLDGLMVTLAVKLGLNRDIEAFYKGRSLSFITMAKNLWRTILYFDALSSFDHGCPLAISDDMCDVSLVDDESLLYKTTMCIRSVCKPLNRPKVMFSDFVSSIEISEEFFHSHLVCVFDRIHKLSAVSFPDATLIMSVYLSIQMMTVIMTLHYVIVRVVKTRAEKEAHVTASFKACLVVAMAVANFVSVCQRFNHVSPTSYSKNQFTIITSSLTNQALARCTAQIGISMVQAVEANSQDEMAAEFAVHPQKRASYNKKLVIDVDEWQHLRPPATEEAYATEKSIACDVATNFGFMMNVIRILLQVCADDHRPMPFTKNVSLHLFAKYSWLLSICHYLDNNKRLKEFKCDISIEDSKVLPSLPPFYERVSPEFIYMLNDLAKIIPANGSLNTPSESGDAQSDASPATVFSETDFSEFLQNDEFVKDFFNDYFFLDSYGTFK